MLKGCQKTIFLFLYSSSRNLSIKQSVRREGQLGFYRAPTPRCCLRHVVVYVTRHLVYGRHVLQIIEIRDTELILGNIFLVNPLQYFYLNLYCQYWMNYSLNALNANTLTDKSNSCVPKCTTELARVSVIEAEKQMWIRFCIQIIAKMLAEAFGPFLFGVFYFVLNTNCSALDWHW